MVHPNYYNIVVSTIICSHYYSNSIHTPIYSYMQLDLSSIDDREGSPKLDASNSGQFQIEQMGMNDFSEQIGSSGKKQYQQNGQFKCIFRGNSALDEDEFRQNLREIMMTSHGEIQYQQSNNDCDKEQQIFGNQFQQPLKGSFLQQMQRLCKTISFQSTIYNIYDAQPSTQNQQEQIVGNLMSPIQQWSTGVQQTSQIIQDSKQKLKTKFFWEFPIFLESKYIVDFSNLRKKTQKSPHKKLNKNKSMQLFTGEDVSRNTIQSMKSTKKNSKPKRNSSKTNKSVYKSIQNYSHNSSVKIAKKSIESNKQKQKQKKEKIKQNNLMMKKSICSPLKKIGISSRNSELLEKTWKTGNTQKEIRNKRKIQMKFKF